VAELGFGNENAELTSDNLGDEALILLENLSYTGSGKGLLVVADNKTRGAKFANAKFRPDVIIIDDGFQHRKLSRDIDLVIINMADGKKLLPAGNLREPFSSLKRSDIVLVNNKFSNGNLAPNKIKFKIYIDAIYEFTGFFDADNLKIEFTPANALAFCGIADPASFRALLEKEYINVDSFLEFPDHHYFSRNELENIADLFKQNNCDAILTTQKDFVRIKYSQSESIREFVKKYPVYFSGINLKLLNESEKLFQKIDRLIT
jgi:tetraacyldisaccharide 4'-kinase